MTDDARLFGRSSAEHDEDLASGFRPVGHFVLQRDVTAEARLLRAEEDIEAGCLGGAGSAELLLDAAQHLRPLLARGRLVEGVSVEGERARDISLRAGGELAAHERLGLRLGVEGAAAEDRGEDRRGREAHDPPANDAHGCDPRECPLGIGSPRRRL